jgi:hypothetical protein
MSFSKCPQERTKAKGVPSSEIGTIVLKLKDFFRSQILKDCPSCMDIPTERTYDSRLFPSLIRPSDASPLKAG